MQGSPGSSGCVEGGGEGRGLSHQCCDETRPGIRDSNTPSGSSWQKGLGGN